MSVWDNETVQLGAVCFAALTAGSRPRLCIARREGLREQATEPGTPVTGQLSAAMYCAITIRLLSAQVVRFLVHLVCRTYDAGVGFVGALADNHVDELFDDTHVRVFQKALPQTAEAFLPPGLADNGIPGGFGRLK